MAERLPRATATEIERAILKLGYQAVRQSGSHRIFKNQEGERITLPIHPNKIIHPKIVKMVLIENHLTVEKFKELLK